jgi:nicotinamide-nucleotide amidase
LRFEVVVIGAELLDGTSADQNTAYLASRLTPLGGRVIRSTTVPDDGQEIEAALDEALARADVVMATGGLGPTSDDRTKQAAARLLGLKLVLDEAVLDRVRAHFESRGVTMSELNVSQAMIPEGARPIENRTGTAPGLMIASAERLLFLLPGVPTEMKSMFEGFVLPFLEGRGLRKAWEERVIRTTGLPESAVAERIEATAKRLARVDVGYLASTGGVDVRIQSRGGTLAEASKTAERAAEKLAAKLEPYVYAVGDQALEEVVGYLLTMAKKTVAVAESCTGGRLGWRFTRVPGSSDYVKGGVIAYSDDIKKRLLGVRGATLKRSGAVSAEVAAEMAEGVRARCKADYGVAITGIAGPGGGTDAKPIGLVHLAVSSSAGVRAARRRFGGGRNAVRERATQAALELLRRTLLDIEEDE